MSKVGTKDNEGLWSTLVLPEDLRRTASEAIYLADRMNLLDSNIPNGDDARHFNALDRIFTEYVNENRLLYIAQLTDSIGDSKLKAAILIAFERDNFRCLICKHSNINHTPALSAHHIIPRSHAKMAQDICGDLHTSRNLATVCGTDHEKLTNPPDESWHWRNVAPRLMELIGEPEYATAIREYKEA